MRFAIAVLRPFAAAILFGACAPPGPEAAPATPPAESVAPTSSSAGTTSPSRIPPFAVSIAGAEGLELKGTYTPGREERGPAVLLLHMYGSDRQSWEPFAAELAAAGITSLAIDLRGHGATGGAEDWGLASQDVANAFAWLQSQPAADPSRVGIVGASIGANLALVHAAAHPDDVAAAALLSPGLDYFRVKIGGLAEKAQGVPLFLAASEQDGYSAETVRVLSEEAPGENEVAIFDGASHGTDLLAQHPQLAGKLIQFLLEALGE